MRARVRRRRPSDILVGTDLVEVRSVAESMQTFGERYLARVFTAEERNYCAEVARAGGNPVPHFAARFAAKEAVMKLLRPRASDAITWQSIEVVRSARGHCAVRLHGPARELARRAGLGRVAISLSHEEHYATAVAVAGLAGRAERNGVHVHEDTTRLGTQLR
jgi:holo-[acyl-carrier protein] synthase